MLKKCSMNTERKNSRGLWLWFLFFLRCCMSGVTIGGELWSGERAPWKGGGCALGHFLENLVAQGKCTDLRLRWLSFISYHEFFSVNSWKGDTWFGSSWNDKLGMGCTMAVFQLCSLGLKLLPEAKMRNASFVRHEDFIKGFKENLLFPFILISPIVGQSLSFNLFWESVVLLMTIFLKLD